MENIHIMTNFDSEKEKCPERYVVMDAKWWLSDGEGRCRCGNMPYDFTSYDGNPDTRFILYTDDDRITREAVEATATHYFKYHGAERIYAFMCYDGAKTDAIRSAVSSLADDAVYIIFDEDNLYADFPGRSVILDPQDIDSGVKKVRRYLHYGYWWRRKDRYEQLYFITRELIKDGFENVIFLDIDGVLNKDDYLNPGEIHEDKVALLADIVRETKAEIVLTSSWRHHVSAWITNPESCRQDVKEPVERLMSLFAGYGLTIADMTDTLYTGPDARPLEIRTWLTRRSKVLNFVILDDDGFWQWNWLEPHFVRTVIASAGVCDRSGEERGLTRQQADKAIEILQWFERKER